ncbi:hypothetical protein T492DRAFT_845873 [Pavlovales sp. CCMP2436]|nr:hypothetical protein T492DRAFT_845873 [Pavlovales sp. CCMP2436]
MPISTPRARRGGAHATHSAHGLAGLSWGYLGSGVYTSSGQPIRNPAAYAATGASSYSSAGKYIAHPEAYSGAIEASVRQNTAEPKYFYHYIDTHLLGQIASAGHLRPSTGPGDCKLGEGVYMTAKPPRTASEKLLANNYGGRASSYAKRVSAYVRIDADRMVAKRIRKALGRDVFVVSGPTLAVEWAYAALKSEFLCHGWVETGVRSRYPGPGVEVVKVGVGGEGRRGVVVAAAEQTRFAGTMSRPAWASQGPRDTAPAGTAGRPAWASQGQSDSAPRWSPSANSTGRAPGGGMLSRGGSVSSLGHGASEHETRQPAPNESAPDTSAALRAAFEQREQQLTQMLEDSRVQHARERDTLNTVIRRAREREMRNAITCEDLRDGRGNLRHVERGKERGDEDLELVGLLGELTSQLAGAHTANEALRDSHAIELSRKHGELAAARREAAECRTALERSQSQRGESRADTDALRLELEHTARERDTLRAKEGTDALRSTRERDMLLRAKEGSDALREELEHTARERDTLLCTQEGKGSALAVEREDALQARDEARRAREALARSRDEWAREREDLQREREVL